MSFLYDDAVLGQLLVNSGVLNELTKKAQLAQTEALIVATKLVQNLAAEANQANPVNNSELYLQDIVGLEEYLNFLMKNQERYDGKLIVYRQVLQNDSDQVAQPPNAEEYVKYKDFFVLKAGLVDRWQELDRASKQAGNEVMKPFVKQLQTDISKLIGTNLESPSDNVPNNPFDNEVDNSVGKPDGSNRNRSRLQVPFSIDEKTIDQVNDSGGSAISQNKKQKQQQLVKDLTLLRGAMPLNKDGVLSPYDMTNFITKMTTVVSNNPESITEPMMNQFAQFNMSMQKLWIDWSRIVSTSTNTRGPDGHSIAPVAPYQDVPYNLAGTPFAQLEMMFGNTPNAKNAARILLQMVMLIQQSIISIKRSPLLTDIFGTDILQGQLTKAQSYISNLTPNAR